MRPYTFLAILSLTACSGSTFNSKTVAISADAKSSVNGEGAFAPGQPPSDAQVAALKTACENAADQANLKTLVKEIKYAERKDCGFGVAPNLERKDAFHQAVESSPATLELPAGTICDISIKSRPEAQLHYDDFLILTLADQVIFASNTGISDLLEQTQEIFRWDAGRILGKQIKNFEARPYCLANGENCRLPGHDETGPVTLNLESKAIAPIALSLVGKEKAAMNLIATGDNDDEDCFHSALDLTVTVTYLAK